MYRKSHYTNVCMKCWTITNKQLEISLVELHPIDKKELKITQVVLLCQLA